MILDSNVVLVYTVYHNNSFLQVCYKLLHTYLCTACVMTGEPEDAEQHSGGGGPLLRRLLPGERSRGTLHSRRAGG